MAMKHIVPRQRPEPGNHAAGGTLGELIAAYRRRRRQPHRDQPWSQEELAFASGTDQAHISRIESNRQHPEYLTLVRICEALELPQTERAYLLALAGYQVVPPLPDEETTAAVVARLAPILESYPYPASLIDEGERLWYVNGLAFALWGSCYSTADDQQACLSRIRGRRTVEMLFDPDECAECLPRWAACYDDIGHVLMRNVALFWRAYRIRAHDPEMNRVLARLRPNADFRWRWEKVESGKDDLLFIDHSTYTIRQARYGRLDLHAWRTRAAVDERFIVTHFSPVDSVTSRVLERLTDVRLRRARIAARTADGPPVPGAPPRP